MFFQMIVKMYTGPLFPVIGKCISECNYNALGCYFAAITRCANKWSDLQYRSPNIPVHRGCRNTGSTNLENYTTNKIGKLARFASTSKLLEVAIQFGTGAGYPDRHCSKSIIFKVYLANKDSPGTNIDLSAATDRFNSKWSDWVFFETEEEVLLLPFFQYQVMSQVKYENIRDPRSEVLKEVILITLMEIPFQNLYRIRQIYQLSVILCADSDLELPKLQTELQKKKYKEWDIHLTFT